MKCLLAAVLVIAITGCSGNQPAQDMAAVRMAEPVVIDVPMQKPLIVFMGDSITSQWDLQSSFPDSVNAGHEGDTSAQMLARFQHDVIEAHASIVVILAGTNDVASNSTDIYSIQQMAAIAAANKIVVILCTIPVLSTGQFYDSLVPTINASISTLAKSQGYLLVDYNSVIDKSMLRWDGIHISPSGYAAMLSMLLPIVQRAELVAN